MSTTRPPLSQRSARAIWDARSVLGNVRTMAEWAAYARTQPKCRRDGWSGVARYLRIQCSGTPSIGSTAYVLCADDTVVRCEYKRSGLYTSAPVSIHPAMEQDDGFEDWLAEQNEEATAHPSGQFGW